MADPDDFTSLLNQSTPYAPKNAAELSRRLTPASPLPPVSEADASRSPEPARVERAGRELPSTAFIPIAREVAPGETPECQVREFEDGSPGLAVYISEELLKERLGADQPCFEAPLLEILIILARDNLKVSLNPHLISASGAQRETNR